MNDRVSGVDAVFSSREERKKRSLEIDSPNISFKRLPLPKEAQSELERYIMNPENYKGRKNGDLERFKDALCYYVLKGTGMRVGEFCSITLADINFDENFIELHRNTKGKKYRKVPLDEHSKDLLSRWFTVYKKIPFKPAAVRKRFRKLRRACDVTRHFTPHSLRHAFGADAIVDGVDIRILKELLGHGDLGTTENYAKIADRKPVKIFLDQKERSRSRDAAPREERG